MEEINIKTLLPVGEKLKPLLSKSCISEADLKGILAERGVFIGDNSFYRTRDIGGIEINVMNDAVMFVQCTGSDGTVAE